MIRDAAILCEQVSTWRAQFRKEMPPLKCAAFLVNIASRLQHAIENDSHGEIQCAIGQAQLLLYSVAYPLGYDPTQIAGDYFDQGLVHRDADRESAEQIFPPRIDLGTAAQGGRTTVNEDEKPKVS